MTTTRPKRRAPSDQRVDVTEARDRIHGWRERGINLRMIERATGVDRSTLRSMIGSTKPVDRMNRALVDAVLAIPADHTDWPTRSGSTTVDSTDTKRRVDELIAAGWPRQWIGRTILGAHLETQMRERIDPDRAAAIAKAYAVLMDGAPISVPCRRCGIDITVHAQRGVCRTPEGRRIER